LELPGGRFECIGVLSKHHPDGTKVGPGPLLSDFPGALELLSLRLDDSRRPVVSIAPWAAAGAPPLWFVEMDASTAIRPMHSMVAFAESQLLDGTIVSNSSFFTMPVRSDEQVGAVRWDTATGEIDQIYVAPEHRGQRLARKLILTAGAYHEHRGWDGKIHVGGRRSDAVEELLQDRSSLRVLPRTERTVVVDPVTGELVE
jgi:GNAT superfamily N-acetyltransferase